MREWSYVISTEVAVTDPKRALLSVWSLRHISPGEKQEYRRPLLVRKWDFRRYSVVNAVHASKAWHRALLNPDSGCRNVSWPLPCKLWSAHVWKSAVSDGRRQVWLKWAAWLQHWARLVNILSADGQFVLWVMNTVLFSAADDEKLNGLHPPATNPGFERVT